MKIIPKVRDVYSDFSVFGNLFRCKKRLVKTDKKTAQKPGRRNNRDKAG